MDTALRHTVPAAVVLADQLARCTLSKWQLMQALFHRNSFEAFNLDINGHSCILSSIAREDGSGNSFNLVVYCKGLPFKVYCRAN